MALELKVASTETHPVHELAGHELICELRKTNMVLYGLFVELVRSFYRFQTPYLVGVSDLRWDPNPQNTGIWIDSELNWNASHPEFVPAIYVKLNPIQYSTIYGEGNPLYSLDSMKDGIYAHTRVGTSAVTFVHVGGTPGEACMLCDNTRTYLSDFQHQIRTDYAFDKFYEAQSNPLQQSTPDSKDKWQSTTTFSIVWNETVRLKLESPILRSIDILDNNLDLHNIRNYGILSSRQEKPDHSNKGVR